MSHLDQFIGERLISAMIAVAHRDLREALLKYPIGPIPESEIYYDIPNLLQVLRESGLYSTARSILHHLIRSGSCFNYMNIEVFAKFFQDPGGDLDCAVLADQDFTRPIVSIQLLRKAEQYGHPMKETSSWGFPRNWSRVAEIETLLQKSLNTRNFLFERSQRYEKRYQKILAMLT